MPVLTEATLRRQRLERLKRKTLQERMLDDYNKRNAEKTAEVIADDPKEDTGDEGGPISDLYNQITEQITGVGKQIGDAWDQGFEWNPGKKKLSSNMDRIISEHKEGGGTGYADQTFPPPPPLPAAGPDPSEKMEAHRKRLAAQKNGLSNKDADELREKRGHPFGVKKLPFDLSNVQEVVESGKNVDAVNEEIRPLGSGKAEDEALYDAKKSLQEYGDIFTQDPESYDYEEPMEGDGFEQAPSDYDYKTAVPPPPKKVVPETVTPETVVPATKTVVPEREGPPDRYSSYPQGREFEKMEYEEGKPEAGGGQGGSRTAEENKVHQDSKELNAKILDPNTPTKEVEEAKEFRKKVYAHLPPRERALAKEETGNYWIDPISGVAINVDAIEADGKRKSNWLMIDKLPEHARPWFMAKFGYLDEEDVDGMPMDPKLKIAEMNVQAKKLELESLEKRHTESTGVQYAQITGKSALQAANLRWEKEKYNNLSKAQQEELQIKQYNQVRSNVDMLFKNGQYESAMLLGQGLGIPYVMDMKGYWRSKAKTTDIDPMFGMALRGSGLEGLSKKAAGTAYYKAIGDYWKDLITPSTDPEMKSSYFQEMAGKNGHRLWNDLSDAERKIAGNPMLHHNSIRSKLLTELMGKDPRFGTLHTSLNDLRAQRNLNNRGDGSTDGANTGKKGPPKPKDLSAKLDPDKKDPRLSEKSSVEELKDMDTKYEFGSGKYTAELAGGLLGLGKWDYDQYDSFMDYRNSKEGLREINKKNLGPEKIKKKLAEAYKTGKEGFDKILAREKKKDNPAFTSIEEAAVYYNKKSGIFGDRREGHELRNDLKYYISRNLK